MCVYFRRLPLEIKPPPERRQRKLKSEFWIYWTTVNIISFSNERNNNQQSCTDGANLCRHAYHCWDCVTGCIASLNSLKSGLDRNWIWDTCRNKRTGSGSGQLSSNRGGGDLDFLLKKIPVPLQVSFVGMFLRFGNRFLNRLPPLQLLLLLEDPEEVFWMLHSFLHTDTHTHTILFARNNIHNSITDYQRIYVLLPTSPS